MIYALLVALQTLLKLTRFAFVALLGVGLGLALGLRPFLALALPADAGPFREQLLLRRRGLLVIDRIVLERGVDVGQSFVEEGLGLFVELVRTEGSRAFRRLGLVLLQASPF